MNNIEKIIEREVKFSVSDIGEMLMTIRNIAVYQKTEYIRDIIFGSKQDDRKIRMRISDDLAKQSVEVMYKYKIFDNEEDNYIKTEIEDILYKGVSVAEAERTILTKVGFVEENSYEKIRIKYSHRETEITLDIYPYGTWVEIEGYPEKIWQVAKKLNLKREDSIKLNADELYLKWIKKLNLKEMWDIRFGLGGNK